METPYVNLQHWVPTQNHWTHPESFFQYLRRWANWIDHPADMPPQLAWLWRGTFYLANGAKYLVDRLTHAEQPCWYETARLADLLQRGVEWSEADGDRTAWFWSAWRGQPFTYLGRSFPTPQHAARAVARAALEALASSVVWDGDLHPVSWKQTWIDYLFLQDVRSEVFAAILPGELWLHQPAQLVTAAAHDLTKVWLAPENIAQVEPGQILLPQATVASDRDILERLDRRTEEILTAIQPIPPRSTIQPAQSQGEETAETKEARGIAYFALHRETTADEIAAYLGVHRATIYRMQQLSALLKGRSDYKGKVPRGQKNRDGSIESEAS